MSALGEVRVDDVPERSRFEVTVDGQQAGYAEYSLRSDRMVLPHTVVDNGSTWKTPTSLRIGSSETPGV